MAEIASEPQEVVSETRPGRVLVTTALLLAMAVTALEQTVVSTAMPSIIAQLQGLNIYPWVFSAYLLACTVTTPIFGKLADIWGRKKVLLFGLGLFTIGSILSGRSSTMVELITMRVVQGLGAAAIGPIVLTMLGDLFNLEERAKVQGLFSAVWGLASVAGPWLGGTLTDNLSWRWVFYVTVPFALLAAFVLIRYVKEDVRSACDQPIDWLGASLLATGSTLLLLAILRGPSSSMASVIGLLMASSLILGLFIRVELGAVDPILPLDLFTRPTIAAAVTASFFIGTLLFGIDTYVPLYVQGVLGGKATVAGEAITPLFFSWALSVALAAKVVVRFGFRATGVVGMAMIAVGMAGLAIGADHPKQAMTVFQVSLIVIGLGFGPASLCCVLGVQNEVDWNRRGVATGAVTFTRVLGGALGVGLLGATLTFEFAHRLAAVGDRGIDVVAALRPETHARLAPDQLLAVQTALGRSLRDVFLQMLGVAVVALICSTRLAAGRAVSRVEATPEAREDLALSTTGH